VRHDLFILVHHFAQVGTWSSSYREDSGSESEEDDDIEDDNRPPSPEPVMPVPSPDVFKTLSIPQQFACDKPVLVATLNDAYEPAKQRHADFIKGGKHRVAVHENVTLRGNIPIEDWEALADCLGRWALRDERRAGKTREEIYKGHLDDRTVSDVDLTVDRRADI
jgi:hypothetical protein